MPEGEIDKFVIVDSQQPTELMEIALVAFGLDLIDGEQLVFVKLKKGKRVR